MAFEMKPFNMQPFKTEPFNIKPFRSTPFSSTPFKVEPFKVQPFYLKPFDNKYAAYNLKYKRQQEQKSHLSNYNDPYENNSIADIFLRPENYFNGKFDLGEHIVEHYVEPILDGNPLVTFINTLTDVGEVLDTVANPVKAVVIATAKGEDVGQAFLDSLGWGGQGRRNFDYDTGNLLVDIALEIVSDPLNWVGLAAGGGAAAQSAGVNSMDTAIRAGLETTTEVLEAGSKKAVTIGNKLSSELAFSYIVNAGPFELQRLAKYFNIDNLSTLAVPSSDARTKLYQVIKEQLSEAIDNLINNMPNNFVEKMKNFFFDYRLNKNALYYGDNILDLSKLVKNTNGKIKEEAMYTAENIINLLSGKSNTYSKQALTKLQRLLIQDSNLVLDKSILNNVFTKNTDSVMTNALLRSMNSVFQGQYRSVANTILKSLVGSKPSKFLQATDTFLTNVVRSYTGVYGLRTLVKVTHLDELTTHNILKQAHNFTIEAKLQNLLGSSHQQYRSIEDIIKTNIDTNKMFIELKKDLNNDIVANVISSSVSDQFDEIYKTLSDTNLTSEVKQTQINNILSALQGTSETTIEGYIKYLEDIDNAIKLQDPNLVVTDLEDVINKAKTFKKNINIIDYNVAADKALLDLSDQGLTNTIANSLDLMQENFSKLDIDIKYDKLNDDVHMLYKYVRDSNIVKARIRREPNIVKNLTDIINHLSYSKDPASIKIINSSNRELNQILSISDTHNNLLGLIKENKYLQQIFDVDFTDPNKSNIKYVLEQINDSRDVVRDFIRFLDMPDEYSKRLDIFKEFKNNDITLKQFLNSETYNNFLVRQLPTLDDDGVSNVFMRVSEFYNNYKELELDPSSVESVFGFLTETPTLNRLIHNKAFNVIDKAARSGVLAKTRKTAEESFKVIQDHAKAIFFKDYKKLGLDITQASVEDTYLYKVLGSVLDKYSKQGILYEDVVKQIANELSYYFDAYKNLIKTNGIEQYITIKNGIALDLQNMINKLNAYLLKQKSFMSDDEKHLLEQINKLNTISLDRTKPFILNGITIENPEYLKTFKKEIEDKYKDFDSLQKEVNADTTTLNNILEDLTNIDIGEHTKALIKASEDDKIQILKKASDAVNTELLENPDLKNFLYSTNIGPLIDQIPNINSPKVQDPIKQIIQKLNPTDEQGFIKALQYLYYYKQSISAVTTLYNNILNKPSKVLSNEAKVGILEAFRRYNTIKLHEGFDVNNIIDDIVSNAEGYINSANPVSDNNKLMNLFYETFIKDSKLPENKEETKTIIKQLIDEHIKPLLPEEYQKAFDTNKNIEHTGLIDACILAVVDKQNGGDTIGKIYLDTETTNKLSQHTKTNGRILDISAVRFNNDNKLEVLVDSKVQLSKDKLSLLKYNMPDDAMMSMYMTKTPEEAKEIYYNLYSSEIEDKDEYKVLLEFVNKFDELNRQGLNYKIVAHNNKFDLGYLTDRLIAHNSTGINVKKKFPNSKYYTSVLDILQNPNRNIDYLEQVRLKKHYKFISENEKIILHRELSNYVSKKTKLLNFVNNNSLDNLRVHLVDDIDKGFKQTLDDLLDSLGFTSKSKTYNKRFLTKEDKLKEAMAKAKKTNFYETTPAGYSKTSFDIDMSKTTAERNILRDQILKLKTSIANILTETASYNEAAETTGFLETALHDTSVVKELTEGITEAVKDSVSKLDPDLFINKTTSENLEKSLNILNNGIGDNMTKFLGFLQGVSPEGARREIKVAALDAILDIRTLQDLDMFGTGTDWIAAQEMYFDIVKTADSISNISAINYNQTPVRITEAIKFLKRDTNVDINNFRWAKISDTNLEYNYATLENLYGALKASASAKTLSSENLLIAFNKKFRDIKDILDNGSVYEKVNMQDRPIIKQNTSKMFTGNWSIYTQSALEKGEIDVDDFGKTTAIISNFENLNNVDFSDIKLPLPKSTKTVGTELMELNNIRLDTFENGQPTRVTQSFDTISRDVADISYTLNTIKLMKSSNEDILHRLIYNYPQSFISLGKTVSKGGSDRWNLGLAQAQAELWIRKSELADIGVKLIKDDTTGNLFLFLDLNKIKLKPNTDLNTMNMAPWIFNNELIYKPDLQDIDPEDIIKMFPKKSSQDIVRKFLEVREMIKKYNLELTGIDGIVNYDNTYEEVIHSETFSKYINNIKDIKPEIGTFRYFNDWNMGTSADRSALSSHTVTNYLDLLNVLGTKMIEHSHAASEHASYIFQSGFKIGADATLDEWKDLANVKSYLEDRPDLSLIYLADDKHYNVGKRYGEINNFKVNRVTYYSIDNLKEAERLHAIIVPYEQYVDYARHINNHSFNNPFLQTWSKLMLSYKRQMLFKTGTWLRNGIDSTIRTVLAGGEDKGEAFSNIFEAHNLLTKYYDDMRSIKKLDIGFGRFKLDNAEMFYSGTLPIKPKLDSTTYHFIYDFMQKNGISNLETQRDWFSTMMSPNKWIEETVRLAEYMTLKDQGASYSQILKRISDTHFNYDLKSHADMVAELFIPFWYFHINNMEYVAKEIVEKPYLFRNLFNIYTPLWDLDDTNHEELSRNKSLQYQIVSGNIPMGKILDAIIPGSGKLVGKEMTLKVGSSILDGLQSYINPVSTILNKLAPPLALISNSIAEHTAGNTGSDIRSFIRDNESYTGYFNGTSVQDIIDNPLEILNAAPIGGVTIDAFNRLAQFYPVLKNPETVKQLIGTLGVGAANYGLTNLYSFAQVGPKYYSRTNNMLNLLMPSILGATSRWKDFPKKQYNKKVYPKRAYAKKFYPKKARYKYTYTKKFYPHNTTWNSFTAFQYKRTHPNYNYNVLSSLNMRPKALRNRFSALNNYNSMRMGGKQVMRAYYNAINR